jgi:hypothetical protein
MEKKQFELFDQVALIKTRFIKDGWATVYQSNKAEVDTQIYCNIVHDEYLTKYLDHPNWMIEPGREGRPSIISRGGQQSSYHAFSENGIEPFLYYKFFTHNKEKYIDVSEEFTNYFHLYETGSSKQNRTYFFTDENGDLEEAIKIEADLVQVKLRFLMEYISVRNVHFTVCFDFICMSSEKLSNFGLEEKHVSFKDEYTHYTHLIRVLPFTGAGELQSWIHGKVMIKNMESRRHSYWFDAGSEDFASFIIGYDQAGDLDRVPCDSEEHKFFTLTYFSKTVLDKYYNNPNKYKVSGYNVRCDYFSLKIDNHHQEYVAVFLKDLTYLPYKEQLHWQLYNIPPKEGISQAYYNTMVLGEWGGKSGALDIQFKAEYQSFNKKWEDNFGWPFYKPMKGLDIKGFEALHLPAENNFKSFAEQVLVMVKLTIDSLNEQLLVEGLEKTDNEKGISKLERFLTSKGCQLPDMILFLRNLQYLRSGMIAHKFSPSNKNCQKAKTYFGLRDDNYREVAKYIFEKSLVTLLTLDEYVIQEKTPLPTFTK